jgi:hypothetical protein
MSGEEMREYRRQYYQDRGLCWKFYRSVAHLAKNVKLGLSETEEPTGIVSALFLGCRQPGHWNGNASSSANFRIARGSGAIRKHADETGFSAFVY